MNEHRGETPITLGGRPFVIRLTTNVLAAIETALDARGNLPEVFQGAGFVTVRAVLWAALTTRVDGRTQLPFDTSLEAVGDMIDASGGVIGALGTAYWLAVANSGLVDRGALEALGFIPKGEAQPDGSASPAPSPSQQTELISQSGT